MFYFPNSSVVSSNILKITRYITTLGARGYFFFFFASEASEQRGKAASTRREAPRKKITSGGMHREPHFRADFVTYTSPNRF